MPKVTIMLSREDMLSAMNHHLRFPGKVESVVDGSEILDEDGSFGIGPVYAVLIDLNPIVDYKTAFAFLVFATRMFGPTYNISQVEDPEDYAVLENMLAAASQFHIYSFDWVDE